MSSSTGPLQTDREIIGAALGRIPSGCFILTVQHGDRSTGVLVSWIQQTSFEPLLISVCLKPSRPAAKLIGDAGRFLINVIGDDPSLMFKHFGKGFSLEEDAFSGLAVEATAYGPLLRDCPAHLACRVMEKVSAGDHDLYLAQVIEGHASPDAKPHVHLRNTGLSY